MPSDRNHFQPSAIAQLLFNALINISPRGLLHKLILKMLLLIRRLILRSSDPLVRYDLNGIKILVPLSHELPLYRKEFPQYSLNVGRIAHYVARKYPDLKFIDIGANVGDTAAILRGFSRFPILCIEGNKKFFAIMQHNLTSFKDDVYCAYSFVGPATGLFKGMVHSEGGTAFLVENQNTSEEIEVRSLDDILNGYSLFRASKMMKIDTDGFDSRILISEKNFLSQAKPVIFMEYDPFSSERYGDDCFLVFDMFRTIGYESIMVYDNCGDYLLTAGLDNRQLLEDIHHYYIGRGSRRYADICVFHRDDADLARTIRSAEIAFFDQFRKTPSCQTSG
jgi:FkbM family methyltransferase